VILAAAREDAAGFLAGIAGPVVIDEVQRAPELFLAIKAAVDRDRRPGRFLLTGSANVLLVPRLAESLAGRMEILTLWPFSQGELAGAREAFVDAVFADAPLALPAPPLDAGGLAKMLLTGGYPLAVQRPALESAARLVWLLRDHHSGAGRSRSRAHRRPARPTPPVVPAGGAFGIAAESRRTVALGGNPAKHAYAILRTAGDHVPGAAHSRLVQQSG